MPVHEFGEWYYLIYLIPGGSALFILLSSVLGGHHRFGGHSHVGVHGHAGSAGPAIAAGHAHPALHGAHTGVATPHQTGHAVQHGHAQDGDRNGKNTGNDATFSHEHPSMPGVLETFFGIGKVPITMVWGSLCLGWGLFGLYGTEFWSNVTHTPFLFVPLGAVAGVLGAVATGRFTAILGARMMPDTESFAVSSVELFGCHGTVVYAVDTEHGRVHVYDAFGTLHDKEARSRSGAIPRGHSVVVLDFDDETDRLIVEEAPSDGRKSK